MAAINESSVKQMIDSVGGAENINAATHCVTRLRLILNDEGKVDKEKLNAIDLVKGSFSANGQFQIVIGNGTVDKVYDLFVRLTGIGEATKQEVKDAAAEKMNPLQKGIKTLADIFIPILPAIVTAGLLMGINNILANPGIFFEKSVVQAYPQWKDFADIILVIANTAFVFLPALIGWSAVKKFGGNPLLGIVLGLVLVHPSLLNAYSLADAQNKGTVPIWDLFGLHIDKVGYQGQVLPVLVASYVLAKLELFLKKHVYDSIQLLVVAPVSLLITGLLSFTIIGPVTLTLANWITAGIVALFHFAPIVGGLVYGFFYGVLVITGMHQIFLAVDLQLIGSTGSTFLWPMLALSNIAQGAAAFAMFLIVRDAKLKGLAMTSSISAWLGITEPAMFGVNLRFRYPFLAAITSSGIAGAFITLFGVKATSIGIGGLPGFLSIIPNYWGVFFIGMLIVLILPFVLTYLFAKFSKKSIDEG
ncbi:PTS system trehalose-specific EIIBC component [Sporolactobacillus terrae]|uniref:PTS system trehalose-specific EIIBC component n=1 Tax=Sporolactobacillus terrae TaxID=269673 RepID=UPI00048ECEF5|nr:PTS system trehalose-specific EIIBC component [Sporolactobacillus terrae]